MLDQQIHVSSEGIRFSYLRFLADSAAGYILIAFIILDRLVLAPGGLDTSIPPGLGVFFLAILFVLATPLGIAINAMAEFLLGWATRSVESFALWLSCRFLTQPESEGIRGDRPTSRWLLIEEWSGLRVLYLLFHKWLVSSTNETMYFINSYRFFGLANPAKRKLRHIRNLQKVIEVYHPTSAHSRGHLEGLEIFLRNVSFLAMLAILYGFAIDGKNILRMTFHDGHWLFLLVIALIGIITSGLVSYHRDVRVLFECYVLCLSNGRKKMERARGNLKRIEECLVDGAQRGGALGIGAGPAK